MARRYAHAGRRFRQAQRGGHLLVRQLFVMPHDDDLAVLFAQVGQRLLHAAGQLLLRGGGGRSQLGIAQLGRQFDAGLLFAHRCRRLFPIDAAFGRTPMPPVGVDDAILGDLPQPQVERHGRIVQVVPQAAVRLDQHVLHHVAHVDPGPDPLVQPHPHHPLHGAAMAVQQLVHRAASPCLAPFRSSCVLSVSGHMVGIGLRRIEFKICRQKHPHSARRLDGEF